MLYFYFLKHEIHHNGSFTFLGPEPLGQVFFIVTCLIAMTFFQQKGIFAVEVFEKRTRRWRSWCILPHFNVFSYPACDVSKAFIISFYEFAEYYVC